MWKLSCTTKKKQAILANFNEKNAICKKKTFFYIFLAFLLIAIALLIAVSIYFCLIKHKSKQKHLLPYYVKNDKLKNVL